MTVATDVTIVGAGPYGLSLAAHFRMHDVNFRIIGSSMQSWRTNMPKGMLLKSAGFASTLYDPGRTFSLRQFCEEQGLPYHDFDLPIPLETFSSYGMAFQRRFAPDLEDENLVALKPCSEGFELSLESGSSFKSRNVVLAVGIDYFRHIPPLLVNLPSEYYSHSAEHRDPAKFRGRDVAVLGRGASAIDLAVLLHEAQANVHLISRKPKIDCGGTPWGGSSRPLLQRLRAPASGIGPGWRSRIYSEAPWIYRYLPLQFRIRTAKIPGPSGGWFMKDRAAQIPKLLRYELRKSVFFDNRVQLRLAAADGSIRQISVDHVIAATGYKIDVSRLSFLRPDILEQLQLVEQSPRLSPHFESSVPGLYFAGPITAINFGPVMRFAFGAGFTSRTISTHLARSVAATSSLASRKSNRLTQPY